MVKLIPFLIVFVAVASCGSTLGYKYYRITPDQAGQLLGIAQGEEEKDDFHLEECLPDDQVKTKCILLEILVFERMGKELIDLRKRVKELEKKCSAAK